jgi:hypothetical protein
MAMGAGAARLRFRSFEVLHASPLNPNQSPGSQLESRRHRHTKRPKTEFGAANMKQHTKDTAPASGDAWQQSDMLRNGARVMYLSMRTVLGGAAVPGRAPHTSHPRRATSLRRSAPTGAPLTRVTKVPWQSVCARA